MRQVFICDYLRTPIGRFGGALSKVRPDDLAAYPLAAIIKRNPGIDPEAIDDVILGCANQAGEDNRNVARMAALLSGLSVNVSGTTVNRLCGSGMDAIGIAARAIMAGEGHLILAGGVESMSRAPFVIPKSEVAFARSAEIYDTTLGWRFINPLMKSRYGVDSMPETAENVAEEFNISREDQDIFALRSQQRAAVAMQSGRLAREIVEVALQGNRGVEMTVSSDEHPRTTSIDQLAYLPTPFRVGGSVTAGNSSGLSDGSAALLIASEDAVKRYNLRPIARFLGMSTAGIAPRTMGYGPVPATHKLLARLGLSITDFDVIEINEAFASQSLACIRGLGLPGDIEHVNPNGGAIALGHPLGASGARIVGTAALELQYGKGRKSLSSMCVGVGQGVSLALAAV